MEFEPQFCSGNCSVPQDLMGVDNGLCFDSLRQLMLSRFQQEQHSLVDHSLVAKQQSQIDQYIISQYEGLRLNLQEQTRRDLASILNRIDSKSRHILAQKDQHIASERNRAAHLEQILYRTQTEQQQWQKLALEKEAQLIHLHHTINQMLLHSSTSLPVKNDHEGDAESCCDVGCSENRAAAAAAAGLCRGCGCREACVVLLPCRHLCLCVDCELRIESCPVCTCLKQDAIEALLQ